MMRNASKKRPNIVFIHTDQQHFGALSAYGNPWVETPHMDRLAAEGHSFMKAHTIMPQCCPARTCWMTGRTSKETGTVVNGCPLNPEIPDLAQWLGRHTAYETAHTGKYHLIGRKAAESFDRVLVEEGTPFGELADPPVARSAAAWILNRERGRPYFISIGLLNPHDCCYTAGAAGGLGKFKLSEKLLKESPPLPASFPPGGHPEYRRGWAQGWTDADWRFYLYSYYRQVEMVDEEVGVVLEAVRQSPEADNTLVILTSDHGDGLAFHGKLSKGFLEDQAWRVPLIVSWPGRIAAGVRDDEHLADVLDIPATVCDYAGAPPLPDATLSRSWRPVLERRGAPWREYVVGETSIPYLGVSFRDTLDTKTIFYEGGKVDVYDTARDPLEMDNLAGTPEGDGIVERHRGWFRDYLARIKPSSVPTWGSLEPGQEKWYGYLGWYAAMKKELDHG